MTQDLNYWLFLNALAFHKMKDMIKLIIYLFIYLSVFPSVCMFILRSEYLSISLSIDQFQCTHIYQLQCASI